MERRLGGHSFFTTATDGLLFRETEKDSDMPRYRIASIAAFLLNPGSEARVQSRLPGGPVKKFCFAILVWLLFALPQWAQSLEGAGVPYVITNVTVVDTAGGPSRPNFSVVIDGNRITYVGKGHLHAPQAGACD